jgi:PAS domain S-box-containing protein
MINNYEHLYNTLPIMMHSFDDRGVLVKVNAMWLRVLGYTEKEVLGKKSTHFLSEKSRKYALDLVLPNFFTKGSCRNVAYQFIKKNNEIVEVLLSAMSEYDSEGKLHKSVAILKEVSEINISDQEDREILDCEYYEMSPRNKLYELRIKNEYN